MTPAEKLQRIKKAFNYEDKENRKVQYMLFQHVDWLISRVEELEKALEYYACNCKEQKCVPICPGEEARFALEGKTGCICGEINARHCPVHNEGKSDE